MLFFVKTAFVCQTIRTNPLFIEKINLFSFPVLFLITIKNGKMNFKRHLVPLLLLLLPVFSFAQSRAIQKLHDDYDKVRLRYFYESVIRAGANLALGGEGVELTKGIQKVVTVDFKHSEALEDASSQFKEWLKEEGYGTYMEVTNRGNLAGMAAYFMGLMGQKSSEGQAENEKEINDAIKEMGVYALDDGKAISALAVVIIGKENTQIYELHGKLKLDSLPEIIDRVQKFIKVIDSSIVNEK